MFERVTAVLLVLGLVGLVAAPWGAAAGGRIMIDGLTVLEGDGVRLLAEAPVGSGVARSAPGVSRRVGGALSLGDGYAACSTSDDVYPFDLTTHVPGSAIALPGSLNYPYGATMRPDWTEVWIADASADAVHVVDMASATITHTVAVGEYPVSVAFNRLGSFAVVACRDDSGAPNIYLVSTSTYAVIDSWVGPTDYLGPGNVALDPDTGHFYLVTWYGRYLYELPPSADQVVRTADLGTSLWQLVVDPAGGTIYVTDRGTDMVRVVDAATLTQVAGVPVGNDPWGIDITPDGSKLYVTCEDSQNVYAVDVGTWGTTVIGVSPGDPRDVDISCDGTYAYVAGGDSGSPDYVYVVDTATDTIADQIALPSPASNVNVVAVCPQDTGGVVPTPLPTATPRAPAAGPAGLLVLAAALSLLLLRRR